MKVVACSPEVWFVLVAALNLAACGGGGGSNTPNPGAGGTGGEATQAGAGTDVSGGSVPGSVMSFRINIGLQTRVALTGHCVDLASRRPVLQFFTEIFSVIIREKRRALH